MFHFIRKGRGVKSAAEDTKGTGADSGVSMGPGDGPTLEEPDIRPDSRQIRGENQQEHTTGLGISLNDYMDQLEADLAPRIAETVTISGSASFELVTLRIVSGMVCDDKEEVEQHLEIKADGQIRFRANTYHYGPGRLGIGRVQDAAIPRLAVQEISRMLDTWLYTRQGQVWTQPENIGKWYLRVRFEDGREQVQWGALDGAFLPEIGIDISQFIRSRVPIDHLYVFDQDL